MITYVYVCVSQSEQGNQIGLCIIVLFVYIVVCKYIINVCVI